MKNLLLLLVCLTCAPVVHSDIVVVVANNSSIDSIDKQQVSNIFLAKTNRFSNGSKAIPIEIRDIKLRKNFYKEISNKTHTQLKSYWTTLIFTGKGRPPKSFLDSAKLIAYMEAHPGAIAYIPLSDVTSDLKIIYDFAQQ